MKRIIALALCVLMLLTCMVGCKKNNSDLVNAKDYIVNMYQTGSKDEPMLLGVDKEVLTVVTVDSVAYNVEWAVSITQGAADSVKISESETENTVLIDIPDLPEEDILFTAIATVKDKKDKTETAEFKYKVKGIAVDNGTDDVAKILNDAYALEQGKKMDKEVTLTGKVTSVDTPYSAQYKNVTVTITIDGFADKPIKCFRLAGNGVDTLAVGDTVTVTGTIVNYQGTIEFDAGCTANAIVKGDAGSAGTESTPTGTTPGNPTTSTPSGTTTPSTPSSTELKLVTDAAKIVKDAFALGKNETTPYIAQLTGKVISIDKEYNEQYGSVSVYISVEGKNILCYNMKGTGTNKVKPGDTITVRGVIKNFYYDVNDASGKVEFTYDQASGTEVVMTKLVAGQEETKTLTIVDTPVVGTAYKFGFFQTKKNATYYAIGGMTGYYMMTSTSPAGAIDVYIENANGGYYLYAMINGKKQYMNMETSGTHVNAVYRDNAVTVYTYDAEKKTLVYTTDVKGECAFGTYGDYTTIGTSQTSKDGYYCHFYK